VRLKKKMKVDIKIMKGGHALNDIKLEFINNNA